MTHSDEPIDLRSVFQYNPLEPCWSCGYAIGIHSVAGTGYFYGMDEGGCPADSIVAYQRWGVM